MLLGCGQLILGFCTYGFGEFLDANYTTTNQKTKKTSGRETKINAHASLSTEKRSLYQGLHNYTKKT